MCVFARGKLRDLEKREPAKVLQGEGAINFSLPDSSKTFSREEKLASGSANNKDLLASCEAKPQLAISGTRFTKLESPGDMEANQVI